MDTVTGTIEVKYTISKYGEQYEWSVSNGDESDYLFDSVEEALADLHDHY